MNMFYPFWGLDVGAIKSSISKFWRAKKEIIIDACFIENVLTLIGIEAFTWTLLGPRSFFRIHE